MIVMVTDVPAILFLFLLSLSLSLSVIRCLWQRFVKRFFFLGFFGFGEEETSELELLAIGY